jgi:hypothetical protein
MSTLIEVLKNSLMITGFVFVMMLIIEYINVQTRGVWNEKIKDKPWNQYLLAALLGATPGCLGAFTVVALYSHRIMSLGALVTAMIATSGDEAFVMFAMFPGKALILTCILFIIGIFAGYLTDRFVPLKFINKKIKLNKFAIHDEEKCVCYPKGRIFEQLKHSSAQRTLLILILSILLLGVIFAEIGPVKWNWIRITLLITSSFSLFIVLTVPEHFLEEHLWEHIVKVHIPRIFLWTLGTLLAVHILLQFIDINIWIADNMFIVLLVALLVGIVPESGPHLIFVTLFASGTIPFSILLASSIVQDGHGMIPMLAESKRGFLSVKAINLVFASIVGTIGLFTGF